MSARPPIHTRAHAEAYPGRVAVIRDSETGEWLVWRGEDLTAVRDTHAEAITHAQRIARKEPCIRGEIVMTEPDPDDDTRRRIIGRSEPLCTTHLEPWVDTARACEVGLHHTD